MAAYGVESLLQNAASTGLPGFALVNGTPNIVSWTAPNDGQMHRVMLVGLMNVALAETGGQITLNYTDPGGAVHSRTIWAAAQAAGVQYPTLAIVPVAPGTTVTLAQASALTAGASTVWAELWAS